MTQSTSSEIVSAEPGAKAIGRVYAEALLGAAGAQAQAVVEELRSLIVDVLAANVEFRRLLCESHLSVADRLQLIDRVVAPQGSPVLTNFLRTLARHRRLDAINAVLLAAELALEERAGKLRVQLTTASSISDETLSRLKEKLGAALRRDLVMDLRVDAELLGGLVLRVEDTVYDNSVRSRLRQLGERLRERCLHEIQRGRDRFRHPAGN